MLPATTPEDQVADTATDVRTLIRAGGARPDRAAVAHLLVSTGFLVIGGTATALALFAAQFPAFLPLGYGVIRAMAMLASMVGFCSLSLIGGVYYVLPRLTGAALWNQELARLGLAAVTVTTAAGMVALGLGLGDGGEPFGLPWWLDLPLIAGLTVPAVVAVGTVRQRREHRTYVTIPYALTGLVAIPLVYLASSIPGLTAVATALGSTFFTSAFLTLGPVLVGSGLAYYAVVKAADRPLAGRPLAQVGYWSLLFSVGWAGAAQLAGGPLPAWLGTVAAVLGLALPVGALATAANLASTLDETWGAEQRPVVVAAMAGSGFAVVVAAMAAVAGFRSAATLLAFTLFWEGITYGLLFGAGGLLIAAWTYQALPRMTGRRLASPELARRHVRLTVLGAGGVTVLLALSGLTAGYSWAGGSFTGAFVAAGEGWAAASGPASLLSGLAVVAGLVALGGQLAFVSNVFRTMTQGRATAQEVLVFRTGDAGD